MMKHCVGDNYQVMVRAAGRDHFETALSMAFNGRQAWYWAESPYYGLVFMWFGDRSEILKTEHNHTDNSRDRFICVREGIFERNTSHATWTEEYVINSFDKRVSVGEILDFSWNWLDQQPYPDPQEEVDAYGSANISLNKGFLISTGDIYGYIGCHTGAICHIKPEWIWIWK